MNRSIRLPIAIICAGGIIAFALYANASHPHASAFGDLDPTLVRPVTVTDHIYGNPAAPVMIVSYMDFSSTYCANFDSVMREMLATMGAKGQVAWVLREFPLSGTTTSALSEARAAECAAKIGGNNAFWDFEQRLFANTPADPSLFGSFAASAGIAGDAFANCYANAASTVDPQIQADRKNALAMKASGTPFSVVLVNGVVKNVMVGAYSYDAVREMVSESLPGGE